MRKKNIIHRDLKPENIILDDNFNIKLVSLILIQIDFSTAKILNKIYDKKKYCFIEPIETNFENNTEIDNQFGKININNVDEEEDQRVRANTFCGTAEYVSPEMLFGEHVGFESDYWALGCILFKLITSVSPFKDKSQFLVFQNIKNLNIKWNDKFSPEAKDLIIKLLKHNPYERLGSNDISEIVNHKYFFNENSENTIEKMILNNIPDKSTFKTKNSINQMSQKPIESKTSNNESETKKIYVIKQEVVEKKSPFFHHNTRLLKLDSTPKLEYSDPETKQVKGSIYLYTDCEAKMTSETKFEVVTPKRTFYFKLNTTDAGIWCKLINEEIYKMIENPKIKQLNESYIENEIKSLKKDKNLKIY